MGNESITQVDPLGESRTQVGLRDQLSTQLDLRGK